jgi:iron(III) transport system permease protein
MTTHIIEKAATKLDQGHAEGATAPIRRRPADKKLFHGLRRPGDGLGVLRTVVWVAIAFLVGLPLAALAVQGIQPAARP